MLTASGEDQNKLELLTVALDHAWRWFELRVNSGLQIVNYYLVAIALTSAAYVSALNARQYALAGMVGMIVFGVSGAAYLGGREMRRIAQFAVLPIRELEDRLADVLDVESVRMVRNLERSTKPLLPFLTVHLFYPIGAAIGVVASIYAWIGH